MSEPPEPPSDPSLSNTGTAVGTDAHVPAQPIAQDGYVPHAEDEPPTSRIAPEAGNSSNRWKQENSCITSLEKLRKQEEQRLRVEQEKNRSVESEEAKDRLIQAFEKTLVAWRARKHRLRRFVRLREKLEIVLIGSLVSVASVASLQSIFGAAQALVMKALLVVTGLVGAIDIVLMAVDPFRRTKLYHARVQKMISAFEDYQRQVILLDPSLQQIQRIAMFAESAYQLLRPQDEDWP